MKPKLGPSIALRDYIAKCVVNPDNPDVGSSWMVIQDREDYSLDMEVFPVILEDWNLEPEEFEAVENDVLSRGFSNCLSSDQIHDIANSLRDQKPTYTDDDLEKAINYYDKYDCFLDLQER